MNKFAQSGWGLPFYLAIQSFLVQNTWSETSFPRLL